MLEALPTVAVEALAAGTPVLSTDNPGGLELNDLFGRDVAIVPREQPLAARRAPSSQFLDDKRRTQRVDARAPSSASSAPPAVAARYRALYERALAGDAR